MADIGSALYGDFDPTDFDSEDFWTGVGPQVPGGGGSGGQIFNPDAISDETDREIDKYLHPRKRKRKRKHRLIVEALADEPLPIPALPPLPVLATNRGLQAQILPQQLMQRLREDDDLAAAILLLAI